MGCKNTERIRRLQQQNKQMMEVLNAIANGTHFADDIVEHLRDLARQALGGIDENK